VGGGRTAPRRRRELTQAKGPPMSVAPEPYSVVAFNTSRDSENKMHDDTVAQRYGFSGGLVPGVDVHAYMVHPAVARWGRPFLEGGTLEARFLKPVYDGETALVASRETADGLAIEVTSRGELCATGSAALVRTTPPKLTDFAAVAAGDPSARPPADETTLKEGTLLGIRPLLLTPEGIAQYVADVRETDPLYVREGLSHPGLLPRLLNWALMHNVVLGPWIHVGSKVEHFAAARTGDELTVRAKVTGNYERKGHRFVELDGLVVANGKTPIARIAHTAIYRPRAA
jgi:acyl dehydratase